MPVKNQDNTEEKPIYFPWEWLWKTSWSQWCLSWVLRGHRKKGYSKARCELKNQTYKRCMFQEQRAVCGTWMRTASGRRESLCFEFQFYSTSSRIPIYIRPWRSNWRYQLFETILRIAVFCRDSIEKFKFLMPVPLSLGSSFPISQENLSHFTFYS